MDFFFSDLPFFWLMFFSESLEQLDEYKKDNKNSVFFCSSTFFSDLLCFLLFLFFMDIFVDKMCWVEVFFSDLLLDEFVLLKYTFFLLMFSSEIFEDLDRTKSKVRTSNFCHSFTIFSDLIFFSIIFLFYGYFCLKSTYFCSIFLLDKCFVFKSTLLCCIYLFDLCFFSQIYFVVRIFILLHSKY